MQNILKKYRTLFIFTVFIGIVLTALEVAIAYIIGQMVDSIGTVQLSSLYKIGIYCIAILILYLLFGAIYTFISKKLNCNYLTSMKEKIFGSIFSLPISKYQEHNKAYYLNLLSQDIDRINENYLSLRYDNVVLCSKIILSLGVLLSVNWKMSLIFIGITLTSVLIPQLFVSIQSSKTGEYSETLEKYVGFMEIFLSGYEAMRSLTIEKSVFKKINEKNNDMENARRKYEYVNETIAYIISTISFFAQLGCMFAGVYFVITGNLTTGQLIMSVQLLNSVFGPINNLSQNMGLIKSNKVIRNKLEPLLAVNPVSLNNYEQYVPGDILIEDFSMELGSKKIFDHFSYRFEQGKSYAIIGPSGSGKSTLAKVLGGYYTDYDGAVTYGGIERKKLSDKDLLKHVRYISPDPFIINENVKNNIKLYRDVPDEIIMHVAKKVGFDETFLGKESLGDGAKYISSGELQRIAIARILLDNPSVIIFDEPAANLDPVNAGQINKLIANIDVSIKIVITHDWAESYLSMFDEVLDFNSESSSC